MDKKGNSLSCPGMEFLVRRIVDPDLPTDSHENRTRLGLLEGWVSAALSLLLFIVKAWLGILSGSVSLLADATNNLTDMGSSLVVAFGFHWSRKPSDKEHPFGHGRIEAVATLVLSIALLVVGAEVAKSGVGRLLNPEAVDAPAWLLAAVGVTLVIKIWMALFARGLARLSRSQVLEADAWNHIFDIAATLLVLAALVAARFNWSALDGWTAIGVALFIFVTGIKYAREAIDSLLGTRPDPEELQDIHRIVEDVEGVMGVHEIMMHQYGDVKMISFHIEVPATLSLMDAHHIAEAAEHAVEKRKAWRALAHVDPVDRSHPLFTELYRSLKQHVADDPELTDFHDVRADGNEAPYCVSFDLVTDVGIHRDRYPLILERTTRWLETAFGERIRQAALGIEAPLDSAPMIRRVFEIGPS